MTWKEFATNVAGIAVLMAAFVLLYQYAAPEYAFAYAFARIALALGEKS